MLSIAISILFGHDQTTQRMGPKIEETKEKSRRFQKSSSNDHCIEQGKFFFLIFKEEINLFHSKERVPFFFSLK